MSEGEILEQGTKGPPFQFDRGQSRFSARSDVEEVGPLKNDETEEVYIGSGH